MGTRSHHTSHPLRRAPLAGLTVLATATLLLACSSEDATSGAADPAAVVIGSDLTSPPYASYDGTTPVGIDPDIMNAIATAQGVTLTWSDTRFAQLIPSLNADNIDVIASGLYITAERAKQVDYVPYFATGNAIIVRSGDAPLVSDTDLCGKSVSVIQGSDIISHLNDETSPECEHAGRPAVQVREFPSDPEALQALLSDQVDAQVVGALVASELVQKAGDGVQVTSEELIFPVQVGLAVRKGDEQHKQMLEDGLAAIKANGQYEEILTKYRLAAPDEDALKKILG